MHVCMCVETFSSHQKTAKYYEVSTRIYPDLPHILDHEVFRKTAPEHPPPPHSLDLAEDLVWLTDSLSGKMILEASDLQRRSRYVEITICWLRELMAKGILECAHVPGTENPADASTKCLALAVFLRHRTTLGFVVLTMRSTVDSVIDVSFQGFLHSLVHGQCVLCGDFVERGQQSVQSSLSSHVESQQVSALLALRKPSTSVFWISELFSFWTCLQSCLCASSCSAAVWCPLPDGGPKKASASISTRSCPSPRTATCISPHTTDLGFP